MRRWHNAVKTRGALERSSRLGRLLQRPLVRRGKAIDRPEWLADPRFENAWVRNHNRRDLIADSISLIT